jgi:general secretion pathway protein G
MTTPHRSPPRRHRPGPRPRTRPRPRRAGFTLVEVIVVVTIIALIATLIAPRVISQLTGAKVKAARTEATALAAQVKLYLLDADGTALTDDFDLNVLLLRPDEGGGAQGPYLENADDLLDPWSHPYQINVPGERNFDFDIVSAGEDGQFGTPDDIVHGK